MRFTNDEKAKAARREAALRRSVYPGLVRRGKISPENAAYEQAVMDEIAAEYEARAGLDKQGELFNGN